MITSRQILNLSEEYFNSTKTDNGYLEVFVNPTPDEFIQATKECKKHTGQGKIRFFAVNQQKKVYIFDAYLGYHAQAAPLLHLPPDAFDSKSPNLIMIGTARLDGKSAVMDGCDVIAVSIRDIKNYAPRSQTWVDYLTRFFATNWLWVDKYIKCSSFLETRKKDFESALKEFKYGN